MNEANSSDDRELSPRWRVGLASANLIAAFAIINIIAEETTRSRADHLDLFKDSGLLAWYVAQPTLLAMWLVFGGGAVFRRVTLVMICFCGMLWTTMLPMQMGIRVAAHYQQVVFIELLVAFALVGWFTRWRWVAGDAAADGASRQFALRDLFLAILLASIVVGLARLSPTAMVKALNEHWSKGENHLHSLLYGSLFALIALPTLAATPTVLGAPRNRFRWAGVWFALTVVCGLIQQAIGHWMLSVPQNPFWREDIVYLVFIQIVVLQTLLFLRVAGLKLAS